MARKSQTLPPPPPPAATEEEIESADLELVSKSVSEMAAASLSLEQIKVLKRIAYYTAKVGLSLEESCLLADFDFQEFQNLLASTPLVRKIIAMKELEFKKDMLHTISQRARSGDDKLAQWLLERKFPDEFGSKGREGGGNGDRDILYEAIEFIQQHGDSTPLINENSGRAVVLKKGIIHKIGDYLK